MVICPHCGSSDTEELEDTVDERFICNDCDEVFNEEDADSEDYEYEEDDEEY